MGFNTCLIVSSLTFLAHTVHCKPIVGDAFEARCKAFSTDFQQIAPYDNIAVTGAAYLPVNSTIDLLASGMDQTCAVFMQPADLVQTIPVSLCRVQLRVPTSSSSRINMEVWLPEDWSGRFLKAGNGGLGGCIPYSDIAYGASYGFATVATDTGHTGIMGNAFYQQPEVVTDFAWRSVYAGAKVGKAVAKQFYKKKPRKSYYIGCSTGGRQGWKAVQDFPEVFDGVVVGAPMIDSSAVGIWTLLMAKEMMTNASAGFLDERDWAQVKEIVTSQCDKLDGAVDGILEDARACKPKLKGYLCKSRESGEWCLTDAQLAALDKLYAPFFIDGKMLHPGTTWPNSVDFGFLVPVVTQWAQYVLFEDPNWDPLSLTIEQVLQVITLDPSGVDSFNPDVSKFRKRGGKILHWHGQKDETIPITNSDRYYNMVSKALKAPSRELDMFYRYFRISGMGHCSGGPGAYAIGQERRFEARHTPEDSILARIVEWVEKGKGPEFVRGTKFVNDDAKQGVAFTRKHCKHPYVNQYFGKASDGTDEKGWRCVRK